MVQLSHPYITTGKTMAFDYSFDLQTFVGKVMSDTRIHISEPLCYTPETNIALLINYVLIKNSNVKNEVIRK